MRDPTTFWSKVERCRHGRRCPRCCWPWHGAVHPGYPRTQGGYGVVNWCDRTRRAVRVAWELETGHALSPDERLARQCTNPTCCNIRHYRHTGARGTAHYRYGTFGLTYGLDLATVEEIYARWQAGETQAALGKEYGKSQPEISRVCARYRALLKPGEAA